MKKEDLQKYIPIAVIIILIILSFLVIRSYILPLISAFILAYLVKPVYDKLSKKFPKALSSTVCVILILLVIFIPFAAIVGGIINQASSIDSTQINSLIDQITSSDLTQNLDIDKILNSGLSIILNLLTGATKQLPALAITLLITTFGVYYILLDWDNISNKIIKYIPVNNKTKTAKDISKITKNLIYGTLLVALIEFVVALVGFYISGVKFFLLLPTLIAIFAFIPGLGPTIVWLPLLIYLIFKGSYFSAIGVLITGLIISFAIDLVLRNKIASKGANTHPLIILVGILGGISVFGIFGFIIGPLILSYTIEIIEDIAKST